MNRILTQVLSLASLEAALEHVPVAMYIKDREGRVLFVNRTMRENYGELGVTVGKTPAEAYAPDRAAEIRREDEIAFAGGRLVAEVSRVVGNGVLHFRVRRSVVRGTELGDLLVATCEDITSARSTEKELERERGLGETILDNAGALVMVFDSANRVVRFNRACERASGFSAGEVLGRYYPSLFQDEQAARFREERHRSALRAGEPFLHEGPWLAREGPPRIVNWTVTPLKDAEGNLEYAVATGMDVTERRQIERALAESERQFRLLWERSKDGMRLTDLKGTTLMVNDAFSAFVGRHAEEMVGRPFWDTYPAGRAEEMRANFLAWNPVATQPFKNVERVERPDGSHVWLDLTVSGIDIPGREPLVLTIARDVTVARRQQEELERARAAAEAASSAKSQFLANMSHELRTPMNAILGLTELLLDSPLESAQREHLSIVRESATTLLNLLNDLLDFSKADAGMMLLDPVDFSLSELARAVSRLKSARAIAKGLSLHVEVAPATPDRLSGDVLRLRQVLTNLLDNAVKFTESGWVKLAIAVAGPSPEGSVRLRFSVSDSGIGVPADKQAMIFQPFTQADGSTTRRYGGTGLGLSISTRLVDLMGGKLTCRSEPGRGSEFWFEVVLPVAKSSAEPDQAEELSAEPLRPIRILVAEDNPANRELIVRLLTRDGHEVVAVPGGWGAFDAVREGTFDAVLMDVQMPELDGLSATRQIRAAELAAGRKRTPIIAMTANASPEVQSECLEAGMDSFVAKPIDRRQLRAVLAEAAAPDVAAHVSPSVEPLLDLNVALSRVGEDSELLREIAQLFLAEYPANLEEIRAAIERQDALALERSAHTLKGSVANFGAAKAVAMCLELEKMGRAKDLERAPQALQDLEKVFELIHPKLLAL